MKTQLMLLFFMLIFQVALAQQEVIRGRVVSSEGVPLQGATVKLKGTDLQTSSTQDGYFSFNYQGPQSVLQVSHIGFESYQTVLVFPLVEPLLIKLNQKTDQLQEVQVSTGYQEIPQERATGSFTKISNELLNRRVSTDILSRLEGMASGVVFDRRQSGRPKISVRGRSTFFAGDQPLIVLDNFPYEGSLDNINPNDIEDITILKDGAASSIWGVRAGNGVIVITTKKGRLNQPLKVSFNTNLTLGSAPDLHRLPAMASGDFIDVEQFLFEKGFYSSQEKSASKPVLSPVVELLIAARDGKINPADAQSQINTFRSLNVTDDFEKYLYQTSANQQYSLSLSGGGDANSYLFSGGYDRNLDNLGAAYNRLNLRAENRFRLNKRLELSAGLTFTNTLNNNGRPQYNAITPGGSKFLYPYARLADDPGEPVSISRGYRDAFRFDAVKKGLLDWEYLPLEDYKEVNVTAAQNAILLTTGLKYRLFSFLDAEVRYQYQSNSISNQTLQSKDSYFTRDLINRYTQADPAGLLTRSVPAGAIFDQNHTTLLSHSGRAQLNFSRSWSKHQLAAIAGAEIRQAGTKSTTGRTYGFNEDILTSQGVDLTTSFPLYNNPSLKSRIPDNTANNDLLNRFRSVFANASYTYDSRYTVSASARKDASNLFGVESNQRVVPLWSAGAAWNLDKERFYKLDWLPSLRLRLTYGYSGNVDNTLSAYSTISYVSAGSSNMNNQPYARLVNPPNPFLKWERTGQLNAGVDFASKNNRLSGTIEYYHKNSTDLIGDSPLDPTTGVVNGVEEFVFKGNVGSMEGSGLDLQLRSVNLKGSFSWFTDALFNYNTTKVTRYDQKTGPGSFYIHSGYAILPVVGKPLYGMYSYPWAGLDPLTGNPLGYVDGAVSTDYSAINSQTTLEQLTYHGTSVPPYTASLRNTFEWKGLSASLTFTGKFAHYFKRESINYSALFTMWKGHKDYAARWKQPGDEKITHVPSMIYPANSARENFYGGSEVMFDKAASIRLQDLTLAYEFPDSRWKVIPKGMQVYVYANNLGMIWSATGSERDPDYVSTISPSASISFGLKANF